SSPVIASSSVGSVACSRISKLVGRTIASLRYSQVLCHRCVLPILFRDQSPAPAKHESRRVVCMGADLELSQRDGETFDHLSRRASPELGEGIAQTLQPVAGPVGADRIR